MLKYYNFFYNAIVNMNIDVILLLRKLKSSICQGGIGNNGTN